MDQYRQFSICMYVLPSYKLIWKLSLTVSVTWRLAVLLLDKGSLFLKRVHFVDMACTPKWALRKPVSNKCCFALMDSLQLLSLWSSLWQKVWELLKQMKLLSTCVCSCLPSLPVPAQSGRKLPFLVAARCGVVKRLLNKWWSSSDITCGSAQKWFYFLVCPESPFPVIFWGAFACCPCFSVLFSSLFLDSAELRANSHLELIHKSYLVFLETRQLVSDQLAELILR